MSDEARQITAHALDAAQGDRYGYEHAPEEWAIEAAAVVDALDAAGLLRVPLPGAPDGLSEWLSGNAKGRDQCHRDAHAALLRATAKAHGMCCEACDELKWPQHIVHTPATPETGDQP